LSPPSVQGLVADLGGTNARFATVEIAGDGEVRIVDLHRFKARDYPTAYEAMEAYLKQAPKADRQFVSIACAGPVRDGKVDLTNLGWSLSVDEIRKRVDVPLIQLINDLEAVAWAAPRLGADDLRPLGEAAAGVSTGGVIAVLGVGTGTNCAAFLDQSASGVVAVGEGGHASFAPTDAVEAEIWARLLERFGHVSIERLVSGPGLFNLYQAMSDIAGRPQTCADSEAVTRLADSGDADAEAVVDRFCRIMGAVAGDFVLIFGASALYLAGGIAPALMCTERRAKAFREGFENKGRFREYVQGVGGFVITHEHTALMGAGRAAAIRLHAS